VKTSLPESIEPVNASAAGGANSAHPLDPVEPREIGPVSEIDRLRELVSRETELGEVPGNLEDLSLLFPNFGQALAWIVQAVLQAEDCEAAFQQALQQARRRAMAKGRGSIS
jgi:hypothetical protein